MSDCADGAGPALDALGPMVAAERALQCSVPKEGGWRPGARWARSDVEAEIERLPAHQRPRQSELGRVSVADPQPFRALHADDGGPVRELVRRTEAADHPFRSMRVDEARGHVPFTPKWNAGHPGGPDQARFKDKDDGGFVPPASEPVAFRHGPGARPPARATPPLQFPGEDAPAKVNRGAGLRGEGHFTPNGRSVTAPNLRRLANQAPVQGPGEDMVARAAMRAPRRSSRDGHDGEAGFIAPPSLKQLATMPAVQFPSEGPHPDHHGKRAPTGPNPGEGRFFQTGRTLGSVVARVCSDEDAVNPILERQGEPPLVTSERVGSRVVIAATNSVARAHGLAPGMALTLARATVPGLAAFTSDAQGDAADLHALAVALARRWSPQVAVSGADGLFLDLTGVAHLHGGERRFAKRLVRWLAGHGVSARVAIADTPGAAHALARYLRPASGTRYVIEKGHGKLARGRGEAVELIDRGRVMLCAPGAAGAALASLPPDALRIGDAQSELLRRFGIDRIATLAALPRGPLVKRFGSGLAERLDQATGALPEPLDPVVPPEPISVAERYAEPIASAEAIACALGRLVPLLCSALAAVGQGARSLELVADRVDGRAQRISIGLARASRDPLHLLRLLGRRIETIEPGFGIDAVALHVRRAEPLAPQPFAERLDAETVPDLAPLVDAIANRVGASRLWRTEPVESDVPERQVSRAPALAPPDKPPLALRLDDVRRLDAAGARPVWPEDWPRPARLLRRPEQVDNVLALTPDHPPRRFRWRGRTHHIVRGDGPERIHGEWWRRAGETSAVRDYYRVEDDTGARFWLFRRGDGERPATGDMTWYLHGLFG